MLNSAYAQEEPTAADSDDLFGDGASGMGSDDEFGEAADGEGGQEDEFEDTKDKEGRW